MTQPITTYNFSDHFIEKLADDLMADERGRRGDFSALMLIFGGKRPALFLKRELARRIGRAFVPPKIISMDEFVGGIFRRTTPSRPLNDMEASFTLYRMVQRHAPDILRGRESFARFRPWAAEILGFIDQADLEDISESDLLNVQANADIGYDVPEAVNRLLAQIALLRRVFHQHLQDNALSRRGWTYLQASRSVGQAVFEGVEEIRFCNFFHWHKTEEKIVRHLWQNGIARLTFQGDERRWPVLKRQAAHLGVEIREGREVVSPDFDLKLYQCSDGHGEAATAGSLLREMSPEERSRCVIVVPEPRHLVPLLSEISPLCGEFNVSMGYPLKRSSLFTLLTLIMRAQASRNGQAYYARDYLNVIRHPFVKNLSLGHDPSAARILAHKIEEVLTGQVRGPLSGCLFFDPRDMEHSEELFTSCLEMFKRLSLDINRDQIKQMLVFIHRTFLSPWETVTRFEQCASVMEETVNALAEKSFMKDYPLNMAIARRVLDLAREWRSGDFGREEFAQEDMFHIIEEALGGEMAAFSGTPLKGLQVLGLVETRSLNFDHVIMIDVNEGCLPRLRVTDPLIPGEVSRALGLNRLEIEEEIQRYQFLRLMSSARTVHLVYRQNRESERSRFIEQLVWDRQKTRRTLEGIDITQAGFVSRAGGHVNSAKKTPAMMEHLRSMTFSASSVNLYLRNPMAFYERYILGIRENDDLLEEPGAKEVGTFVHALLHQAFEPLAGKQPVIDAAFRKRFEELFERLFAETFVKSMKSDAFLLKTVLKEKLKRFLDHEEESPARRVKEILALEQSFTQEIKLSCGPVTFKYVVDRIDRMDDGRVMIIDYKTGGSLLMPAAVERWKDHPWDRSYLAEKVKSFQIPLYYHYLRGRYPDEPVNAALYNLKSLSFDTFLKDNSTTDPEDLQAAFLKALDFVISEILDPETDFVEDLTAEN